MALFLSAGAGVTSATILTSVCFPFLWVCGLALARAYDPRSLYAAADEFRRITHVALVLFVGASVALTLPRQYQIIVITAALICTMGGRYLLRHALTRRRRAGSGWTRRVIVVGHAGEVRDVMRELERSPSHGHEVVGACLLDDPPADLADVPVVRGSTGVPQLAEGLVADTVVVLPCHHLDAATLRRLRWELERSQTEMLVAPGLFDVARRRMTLAPAGDLVMVHVGHAELFGVRRVVKDVFDRVGAAVALVLCAPLLLLLMLAVRMDSAGPAIFRQERVGRHDRPFVLFKLRTMVSDAESQLQRYADSNEVDGVLFKMRDDPRLTRLGGFLRRYSLDELPQLVNVLLGQMSLVGPRPPLPAEVAAYEHDVRRRLVVKPGITGLWQVSGRSDLPWDEAVRLDLRYVENWSLLLDLSILWRSGRAVLAHQGAY